MIRDNYNHPSIAMWGYMNEVCLRAPNENLEATKARTRELAHRLNDAVLEEDTTRMTTMAFECNDKYHGYGLSGITANPLVGRFSDYIVAAGGTTVLSEVPEMFGAEQLLMNRAKDEKVFGKTVKLINDFKDYFRRNGQTVYENPSPGNKAGGITTLEDKSLGCTQKSGSGPVEDVVFDDGYVTAKGLNLLNGPGNDMCAVTNIAAAGCHLVLFTTGRGTPFGGFVPTLKIATNSELAAKKSNWIDFNAGAVLESDFDVQLENLIDLVVDTANGKLAKNEINQTKEIAIFKTGVTL